MERRLSIFLLLVIVMLTSASQVCAQTHRSKKTMIRNGLMIKPDTLVRGTTPPLTAADSALMSGLHALSGADSLVQFMLATDSVALDSIRGTIPPADSATLARFDAIRSRIVTDSTGLRSLGYDADRALQVDSALMDSLNAIPSLIRVDTTRYKKGRFMSDSMSLSKVCWFATVLPGYGQIYNKQYWKLPILYGALGAGLTMYFSENKTYKPLKRQYDALVNAGNTRTPELEAIQTKMIRSNTRRQLYLGASIASYLYFIGDAAVNYATNDVSHVKKATTLACICPGAGQIYNKSYWKVPFVVGGFAALIYCIDWNNRGFQRFKLAYGLMANYEKNPDAYPDGSPDEFHGRYKTTFLRDLKNSYRRNRDLCIIITAGLYILQIVDAHVDAHLKDYDISDDLSMNIEPMVDYTFMPSKGGNRPVFGFNVGFNF